LLNEAGAVRCFDTDQENTTFTHYEALGVRHVTVVNQSRLIDPKKLDALMETLLTEEGNFVIDTGRRARTCRDPNPRECPASCGSVADGAGRAGGLGRAKESRTDYAFSSRSKPEA
jgi:hypothetical protein